MSPSPPRASLASLCLLAVASLAARPSVAQDLTHLAPASSFSLMHMVHDPSMDFAQDAGLRVWNAVRDANLPDVLIDAMAAGDANESDVAQVQGLVALASDLVGNVPWGDLIGNEMMYAESGEPPLTELSLPGMLNSYLAAFRPDADKTPEIEQALVDLLDGIANITDELSVVAETRPGSETTRTYTLTAGGQVPLVHLAARGDVLLIGFGSTAFEQALALLEGQGGEALADTPRYQHAIAGLPVDAPQFVYFDADRMVNSLFDQLGPMLIEKADNDWRVSGGLDDLHQLVDFVDTTVTAVHAEGHTLVSECWTHFDPIAVGAGNPAYQALARPADVSELLDYIPADATSFSVHGGVDLRPLYRWALDRVQAYVPEASDPLIAWDGIQAALDIDMQRDVLSWVGSESVSIHMPARRPGHGDEDWISITRLRDPDGARKVLARVQAVYNAVVPPLIERLKNERGAILVLPRIELSPAGGSFPSLQRLSISITIPGMLMPLPPIPDITFGVIGNQLIATTSEETLLYVMDVAAGEADGLWEHPAMTQGRLPEGGSVNSCRLVAVGENIRKATQVMARISGTLPMLLGGMPGGDSDQGQVMKVIGDLMPRVLKIMRALDFLEDEVGYSVTLDNGLTRYSRSTMRYRNLD